MSKCVFALTVLLVLTISFSAFATPPVWQALGGDHRFLIDNTNYTAYPGRVTSYGNSLFILPTSSADSGSFYQQRYFTDDGIVGGVLFDLTSNITLGYHYNVGTAGIGNLGVALSDLADPQYANPSLVGRLPAETLDEFDELDWATGMNTRLADLNIGTFPDLFVGAKFGNIGVGARLALTSATSSVGGRWAIEEDVLDPESDRPKTIGTMTKSVMETSNASAFDLSLGATIEETPIGDVDIGVSIGSQSFDDEGPVLEKSTYGGIDVGSTESFKVESTGGSSLAIDLRLNKTLGKEKKLTLIPLFNFSSGELPSLEYHEVAAPHVAAVSYTGIEVGLGFRNQVAVGDKEVGTLIGGLLFGTGSSATNITTTVEHEIDEKGQIEGMAKEQIDLLADKIKAAIAKEEEAVYVKKEWDELSASSQTVTLLAGYEFPIKDWLTWRTGASAALTTTSGDLFLREETEWEKRGEPVTVEERIETADTSNVSYYYNMGFQVAYEGVIIDAILARNMFHRGPYLLTGAADAWATSVSVTYPF